MTGDIGHGGEGMFEAAFARRFGTPLPDVLNAAHHLLIVASVVDARTERIVRYLSEQHGVSINAVTFNYFQTADGRELLARTHLLEPEAVEQRTERASTGKRRAVLTLDEHRAEAERRGVLEVYDLLFWGLESRLRASARRTLVSFLTPADLKAAFNIVPAESSSEGGLRFNIYQDRFAGVFGIDSENLRSHLPPDVDVWSYAPDAKDAGPDWGGYTGLFREVASVRRFLDGVGAKVSATL